MQIVYACHLALPDSTDGGVLDRAAEAVSDWVRSRFDVTMQPLTGGGDESNGARVEWLSMFGAPGGLIGAFIDQPDRTDDDWRWRTYVDLGVESGCAWVRIRVGLYSPLEGLVTSPRVTAGRPGVVRALVDHLEIRADGWALGEWQSVRDENVDRYLEFLRDPGRRLPLVVLSEDPSGETFLDPAHLTDRLLGLAHVVTVDRTAAFRVTGAIGKALSCFQGAVRIYWPRFSTDDDPYYHRLFLGGTLNYLGRDGLEAELFDVFGRLAGLSLGEPPLRRKLKIEKRAAEVDARIAERAGASERFAETARTDSDYVTAEEFAEFAADYDAMQRQVAELELAALDAEIEIESLREERDDARLQLLDIVRSTGGSRPSPAEAPEKRNTEKPSTVIEAVQLAAQRSEHTVYLPDALDSAKTSRYEDPTRVLTDLLLVEEIARDWASGELPAGPHTAFKQRCSAYRDGIGQTAATQYAADYERDYNGARVVLGPHIRRGTGAVVSVLRIYMYFDTVTRRIVVGHVGRKLRDAGNRN
jgi:hypothetical protein